MPVVAVTVATVVDVSVEAASGGAKARAWVCRRCLCDLSACDGWFGRLALCVCVCVWERESVRRMWLVAQARVQLYEANSAGAGLRGYLSDDWMRMDWQVLASEEGFWCHPDKLGREVWLCLCVDETRVHGRQHVCARACRWSWCHTPTAVHQGADPSANSPVSHDTSPLTHVRAHTHTHTPNK